MGRLSPVTYFTYWLYHFANLTLQVQGTAVGQAAAGEEGHQRPQKTGLRTVQVKSRLRNCRSTTGRKRALPMGNCSPHLRGVNQWIGSRENLNRKPWFLPSNWSGFPVNFPIIQFYESREFSINRIQFSIHQINLFWWIPFLKGFIWFRAITLW